MSFTLTVAQIQDIKTHALKEFPNESCGLIVDGIYVPCVNAAPDPEKNFVISSAVQASLRQLGKKLECVAHSHPNGPRYPSEIDMRQQIASGLPWALVATDGEITGPVELWGADAPVSPVIGREFMHGIRDCYSLVRDVYRLGKEELAKQGVAWPLEPILIPDFPRDDAWWGDQKTPAQTLYVDNFEKAGFVTIKRDEIRPGDGFLMKIRSQTYNHAGLFCSDGTVLHHMPHRLSRRDPSGIWANASDMWLRYAGKPDAS